MPSSALSTRTTSSFGSASSKSGSSSSRFVPATLTPSSTIKPCKERSNTITPTVQSKRRNSNAERDTPHSNGLLAQLHHLFPHHALFHVRLHIHQLSSVPLVTGEFGVKWKFKNVHSSSGNKSGLLKKVKGRRKGKERADEEHDVDDDDADDDYGGSSGTSPEETRDDSTSIPSVVISGQSDSTSFATDSAQSSTSNGSTSSNTGPSPYVSDFLYPTSDHGSSSPGTTSPPVSTQSLSSTTPPEAYAPARGYTAYVPLKDHNVTWEHKVDIVVQMGVERDTCDLLPNELKLVVLQRVIAGDLDAPSNPRLGAIYLNLAEYADVGPVTRRYLLRESKTNATLKLTIELEHVGGETPYKPPPLPKGEILGGIAGLLENDVYRTRPRTLELFSEGAGLGLGLKKRPGDVPFDLNQLPIATGPKITESLIEAIFNPVPTTSREISPFTYYAPPEPKNRRTNVSLNGLQNGFPEAERASLHSNSSGYTQTTYMSAQESVHSGHSNGSFVHCDVEFGAGGEEKSRSWWGRRKLKSRPATPAS